MRRGKKKEINVFQESGDLKLTKKYEETTVFDTVIIGISYL